MALNNLKRVDMPLSKETKLKPNIYIDTFSRTCMYTYIDTLAQTRIYIIAPKYVPKGRKASNVTSLKVTTKLLPCIIDLNRGNF